jgi:hypothetical protein
MFEEEEYRQIEGYDNYSVSNMGNVRNDKTGRIRKPTTDRDGYLYVDLWKKCKGKTHKIHRLVAIAFLENPDNLEQIDHINHIKDDNRIENLRWCSCGNNNRNKQKKEGTTSKYRGICWRERDNIWVAYISLNGNQQYLGCFKTEEEAYAVWCKVVRENNLQEFYSL